MNLFKKMLQALLLVFVIGANAQVGSLGKTKVTDTLSSLPSDKVLTRSISDERLRVSNITLSDLVLFAESRANFIEGNVLSFENNFGNFYNINSPNGSGIVLDTLGAKLGGVAIIYSKSSFDVGVQGANIYKIGEYTADDISVNKMKFIYLGGGLVEMTIDKIEIQAGFDATEIDFKAMNFAAFYRASDAVVSGTDIVSLPDLSGFGHDLTISGDPQFVEAGINGRASIRFDGNDGIFGVNEIFTERTDLTKIAGWVVFQLEDPIAGGTYSSIMMIGASSYSSAGSDRTMHLYNTNSVNNFYHSVSTVSSNIIHSAGQLLPHSLVFSKSETENTSYFDSNSIGQSKASTDNVSNERLFMGVWDGKGMKGLISEFGFRQEPFTVSELENINIYLRARYGMQTTLSSTPIEVINEGVGGNTTDNVIARISDITDHSADMAVVQIGVNDFRVGVAASRNTPAQFKINLNRIVDSLQVSGVDNIIIQTMPPILNQESSYVCAFFGQPSNCDANAEGDPFRIVQAEVVAEQGAGVYLHDLNQGFISEGQPTYDSSSFLQHQLNYPPNEDGVHYSSIGATYVAQSTYDFIQTNSLPYTKIVFIGDSNTVVDGLGVQAGVVNQFLLIHNQN